MTLIAAFIVLLLVIVMAGYPRITLTRKVGIQGIDDPEAVRAYDRISRTPQFALLRRMFVRELKRHKPQGSIVDVGCGPGYLITVICREMPQVSVIGVDISEEMLATAVKNLSSLGYGERANSAKGKHRAYHLRMAPWTIL